MSKHPKPPPSTDALGSVTPKQWRAIAALGAHSKLEDAAATAEVSPRHLRRWMREDDAFKAALHQARLESVRVAATRMASLAPRCVDVLEEVMSNPEVAAQTRCSAATKLLELAHEHVHAAHLNAKLEAMLARQDGRMPIETSPVVEVTQPKKLGA